MGQSSSDIPPLPPDEYRRFEAAYRQYPELQRRPVEPAPPPQREPVTRYIVLFALTVATTIMAGMGAPVDYVIAALLGRADAAPLVQGLPDGLWYSFTILSILGAHEFGHYFACVFYRVNASLPYFLPVPLPVTGTLGAVIRIRQAIPGKRPLFDIGIAGPIAGFVVALPMVFIGMGASSVAPMSQTSGLEFGEPLLLKFASWLTFGRLPEAHTVVMHPILHGAWFGLFATALNLMPISQLDGGHITYAVFGRKSTMITIAAAIGLPILCFLSLSWIVWSVFTIGMLFALGPHHPRVMDEEEPLDRTRIWLAVLAAAIFAICFTPFPISVGDLVN